MSQQTLEPDYHFLEEVESAGPFQTGACYQCHKCTNGCPVTFAMDLYPDEVIRMVILGQRERALNSETVWVCAACEICTTRCPNEVKIVELMDHLKELAVRAGLPSRQPQILGFHEMFLKNIHRWGRLYETALLPVYLLQSGEFRNRLKTGSWYYDLKLGLQMLAKGRFPLFPKSVKAKKEVRQILSRSKPRA